MSATGWTTTCCQACAAGMKAVFVRRGPWGWMHAEMPEIEQAHLRLGQPARPARPAGRAMTGYDPAADGWRALPGAAHARRPWRAVGKKVDGRLASMVC